MKGIHSIILVPAIFTAFFTASFTGAVFGQEEKKGSFEGEVTVKVKLNYLIFLPDGYKSSEKKWPLLVFLHGAGERGDDLERVKVHGPPKLAAAGKKFPFIILAPQCPRRGWWNADAIAGLVDAVCSEYRVDRDRMYLTGLSMGGFGSWDMAAKHPGLFAAIAPICGGGDPEQAKNMKDIPIWVFHGGKDPVVPIQRSKDMVEALKAAGNKVKFTVYPDAGHDSWTEAYNNPELYKWFLKHRRSGS
jgi:predicted peptidase